MGKININLAEAGKGEISIVMVHGWTNNWIGLRPIARRLAKRFKVFLVELPGWGDSDRLESYDLATESKYLRRLIRKIKLKKPFFFGSLNGYFCSGKML